MQCVWPPQPSHTSARGVVLTPSEIWPHCWWQMAPGPSQAMVHTDSSHLLAPSGPAVSTWGPLSASSAGDGLWAGQSHQHWALWWSCFELTLVSQRPRKKGRHTVSYHWMISKADVQTLLLFFTSFPTQPKPGPITISHPQSSLRVLLPFKIFSHHLLHVRNGK